jgi:hypothetical protein
MAAHREVTAMPDGQGPGAGEAPAAAGREHSRQQDHLAAKALHEGVVLRLTDLGLDLIVMIGLMLHSLIPYVPAGPLLVLAASSICFTAAVRARHYARITADLRCVGGLLYTAFIGSGLNILFAGITAVGAALHASGGAIGTSSPDLVLNLSWPAIAVSVLAIALAYSVTRGARRTAGRR